MTKSLYLNQKEFERIFKNYLKISSYSMSIKTLFGERLLKRIKYDPYYQRNYVWDRSKATFFIESVLLGTDIPPLIFFNSGGQIEVIDGRQRFETIKKFKQGDLNLALQGLHKLPQLQKNNFNSLGDEIKDIFDDAKIRIFEFEIINEPLLETPLEDKIKKEIFRRYNSGITPLSSAEIDNASYDNDDVTNLLKEKLTTDKTLLNQIVYCFLGPKGINSNSQLTLSLEFLRKHLVLTQFPISAFAAGNNRKEILDLYYDFVVSNTDDATDLCNTYLKRIKLILNLRDKFKNKDFFHNRLVFECMLWAIDIVQKELPDIDIEFDQETIVEIEDHYSENARAYSQDNSFYYRSVIDRYKDTATFFGSLFGIDFSIYIKNDGFKRNIKMLRQSEKEAKLKLEELEGLRANKPDPSLIPVDEIINELNTKKYLLRPSYQRQERISIYKASAIIESIVLGISLPPIFIYKNSDSIKEVVDGQQRLLSILGFVGKQYLDENGKLRYPNNSNYPLKKLKILKELNDLRFGDLDNSIIDKILDFRLQIIEIDQKVNPNFEPVDLFIRLNNKPFPIKDNSFEMWNSFADKDVIQKIKKLTDQHIDWFFINVRGEDRTRDRMNNEELITMLSYICYRGDYDNSLGVYLRDEKLNCRIREKKSISLLLEELSIHEIKKKEFLESVEHVSTFINNLSTLLGSGDKRSNLNQLFSVDRRRSLVDFYMLYLLLEKIKTPEIEKVNLQDLKIDFSTVQNLLRNAEGEIVNENYLDKFHSTLQSLIKKYEEIS